MLLPASLGDRTSPFFPLAFLWSEHELTLVANSYNKVGVVINVISVIQFRNVVFVVAVADFVAKLLLLLLREELRKNGWLYLLSLKSFLN